MIERKKSYIPAIFIGICVIILFALNVQRLFPSISEEEYAQYNALKMESELLQGLSVEIDSAKSNILNAEEQLKKMKRGRKGFQKEIETFVSNLAEKVDSFNKGIDGYEQKKLFLPAELRDSLKIFQKKGSPSLFPETSNPPE